MSYEPTLIIRVDDLQKYDWENAENDKALKEYTSYKMRGGGTSQTPAEYIANVIKNHDIHNIGGIVILLCTPEFTTFNNRVRRMLSDLKIRYWEDN